MRTVTDAFKAALRVDRPKMFKEVAYKRYFWDAAENAYDWENDWTVIPEDDVSSVSAITEQLDSEQLNEFKVSNLTLTLKNADNRWREDNAAGIFAPDAGSRLHAYNPYWTKFRVRVAVLLADGTYEYVTRFTGLATEFTYSSRDLVQITVNGLESLLMNANAEDVSTRVVEENAGAGNGILTAFDTVNPGVGIIEEVSLDGIEQQAGTDFDVSQLDDPTLPAVVTFSIPPGGGVVVRITYRYWQQNKRIEEIVEDLLVTAGLDSAALDINPVLFSQPILNAITVDSTTDWLAGTLSKIDYQTVPGSIKIDLFNTGNMETLDTFADGDFTNNPTWNPSGNLTWSVTGGKLRYVKGGVTVRGLIWTIPNTAQIGEWYMDWVVPLPVADRMYWGIIANGQKFGPLVPPMFNQWTGTWLQWIADSGGNQTLSLFLNGVEVASMPVAFTNGESVQFHIRRHPSGLTQVIQNGTLLLMQGVSTDVVAPVYFGIGSGEGAFSSTQDFDNFHRPKSTFDATYTSDIFDMTAGLQFIGKMFVDYTAGGGTVTFETRTSTDGISFDAWTEIASNGQVLSATKRYIQFRITFSHPSSSYAEPIVHKVRIEYQTNVANITVAKFTGQTVYQAVQTLGQFCNYEWGFTPDERFFFRAKHVDMQPDVELGRNYTADISAMTTGYDRVYSEVRVTYGQFTAVLKAPGDTPKDPRARFGSRIFEVSVTDIIIGNDADIATGVSKIFFAELTKPRRRFKAACGFLPHVDLSDTALVTFDQNRPRKAWHMGDETVEMGDNDAQLFGQGDQVVDGMSAKIIGARHNMDQFSTELDLEEII